MQIPDHNLDHNLMRALSFGAHDLEANRTGRLTERQGIVWRVQQDNAAIPGLMGAAFFILGLFLSLLDGDLDMLVFFAIITCRS